MSTISKINQDILYKLDTYLRICVELGENAIATALSNLLIKYHLSCTSILLEYNRTHDDRLGSSYNIILQSEGIISLLNRIESQMLVIAANNNCPLAKEVIICSDIRISEGTNTVPENICTCGAVLERDNVTSEYVCSICGITKNTLVNDEDKSQFIRNPMKKSNYIHIHHAEKWLQNILARVPHNIDQEQLFKVCTAVSAWLAKHSYIRNPTSKTIRIALKELQLVKYYCYTSYILEQCTCIRIPRLTDVQYSSIIDKYMIVLNIIVQNPTDFPSMLNNIHYPYIIYKLIELSDLTAETRKSIMSNIYMQRAKTIQAHDKKWEVICVRSNNRFKYTNTVIEYE